MSRVRLAERLWAASQSNPALADDLRDTWTGSTDVQDALWWYAHPLTPTPGGAPDPALALRPLQTAVFARPPANAAGREESSPAAEERLRVLVEAQAVHARAVEALLDAFDEGTESATGLVDAGPPSRADGPRYPSVTHRPRAERTEPMAVHSRRASLALLAAGTGLGILGTLGVQSLATTDAGRNAPLASVDVEESQSTLPFARPTDDPIDVPGTSGIDTVFQIFTQPPLFLSQPLPALGSDIVPESVREISTFHSYATYAAMNFDGDYCLIIHGFADDISASGCSRASQVRASGQRVDTTIQSVPGDAQSSAFIEVRLSWLPDGTFQTDVAASDRP